MNLQTLLPKVESAALSLYSKVATDEKQANEALWRQKHPGEPMPRFVLWDFAEFSELQQHTTFRRAQDPDWQFIRGIAMACDAIGDDALMTEIWNHFHEHGPDDARVACQWAFQGCAGWFD